METNIVKNGDKQTILKVAGELRTSVAKDFEQNLLGALAKYPNLIVDMAEVPYISSAGLRALLAAQQYVDSQAGRQFVLIHVGEEVMSVFKTTGFVNVLTIK